MSSKFLIALFNIGMLLALLAACGTPTTPAVATPIPTQKPTRIVVQPTQGSGKIIEEQAWPLVNEKQGAPANELPLEVKQFMELLEKSNVEHTGFVATGALVIGCPDNSSIVRYASSERGAGVVCNGSAAQFNLNTQQTTMLIKIDGEYLKWQHPSDWKCTGTFKDGKLPAEGKIKLSTAFPTGLLPLGTGFSCVKDKMILIAVFGQDIQY